MCGEAGWGACVGPPLRMVGQCHIEGGVVQGHRAAPTILWHRRTIQEGPAGVLAGASCIIIPFYISLGSFFSPYYSKGAIVQGA